ncbi:MAG: hypothetical protein RIB98_15150 [Acidimicrobiales bacterium]
MVRVATVDELTGDDVRAIAGGIAAAVTPSDTLDSVQVSLLEELVVSLFGCEVDLTSVERLDPERLATVLAPRPAALRHRIVHLMVLGELILRPIPPVVARRVSDYADALGVDDKFVRVARRYAQGAFGLAWLDLHQSGFAEHWESARRDQLKTDIRLPDQISPGVEDPALAEAWAVLEHLDVGTLGRSVWDMYHGRGFSIPGSPGGASAYLAQHDFVHVLADYGTNLNGEIEVFSLIGFADPDPKGFAWLTTLIGLFETGYVADAGFFSGDLKEKRLDSKEMHVRLSDALSRGNAIREALGTDLLDVDFHELAERPVDEVREVLSFPPKSDRAVSSGSVGAFDLTGMSVIQQAYAASLGSSE